MNFSYLAITDIPGEVISLAVLLLISLVSWIKNRSAESSHEYDEPLDDPYREVIWRRQTGQETEGQPWEVESVPPPIPTSPPPLTRTPPPLNPQTGPTQVPTGTPWQAPKVAEVSKKEAALARAFERSSRSGGRASRRNRHRREIDRLLRTPSAAQNAVVLREILGPPVALRDEPSDLSI